MIVSLYELSLLLQHEDQVVEVEVVEVDESRHVFLHNLYVLVVCELKTHEYRVNEEI